MRRIALLALFMLAAAAAPPASAETFEGTARVANRTIALPPGTWTKVAEELTPRGWQFGGPPQNLMNLNVAFMRAAGGRVTGFVLLLMSRDGSPEGHGYTPDRNCSRQDLFAISVPSNYPTNQDCSFVSHTLPRMPRHRQSFAGTYMSAAQAAGTVAPTYLSVFTLRADGLHYLRVLYYFAPESAGFPPDDTDWTNNGWHKARLDASRRAYMERMKAWAELAQEQTRRSFRNQPVTPLPEP